MNNAIGGFQFAEHRIQIRIIVYVCLEVFITAAVLIQSVNIKMIRQILGQYLPY